MAVEVSDIAPVDLTGTEGPEELAYKLVLVSELLLTIIRDLESLDARVTALEP